MPVVSLRMLKVTCLLDLVYIVFYFNLCKHAMMNDDIIYGRADSVVYIINLTFQTPCITFPVKNLKRKALKFNQ